MAGLEETGAGVSTQRVVDNKIVHLLTASGTADECLKKVRVYVDEGWTCSPLWPIGDNVEELIQAFAES